MLIGSSVGPIVTFCIFLRIGDQWTISECRVVILIGLGLYILPVSLLFFMKSTIETTETILYEIVPIAAVSEPDNNSCGSDHNHGEKEFQPSSGRDLQPNIPGTFVEKAEVSGGLTLASNGDKGAIKVIEEGEISGVFYIPSVIAACDIISGLASGMTIKFFPIFFMNNLRLTPLRQSALFAVHTSLFFCSESSSMRCYQLCLQIFCIFFML